MLPKGKKVGKKKAAPATNSKEASTMNKWLTKGKKPEENAKEEESSAMEQDPIVDTNEPVAPPVKRPKRGAAPTAPVEPVVEPPKSTESQMEGVEPTEGDAEEFDMNLQIDEIQAKAASPIELSRRARGARYRPLSNLDEDTAALLQQYEGDAANEADDLLNEVLGTKNSNKYIDAIDQAKGVKKRSSSRIATLQIASESTPKHRGPDALDRLLAKNEREEQYSQRLAQTLGEIDAVVTPTENTGQRSRAKVRHLESIETNEFQHETSYLVVYFALASPPPKLPSFLSSVPFESPDPSLTLLLPALAQNTPENQEMFNQWCSTPGAILKLPLLKTFLRKRPCPPHVADWLVNIMLFAPIPQTAFEAYDALLNLLPAPIHGWRARIAKNNAFVPSSTLQSSHGLPFFWDYARVADIFNSFGAGQLASIVASNSGKALLKDTIASLPRLLTGKFDISNLMGQLEHQANSMTDEVQAAAIARAAQDLQKSLQNSDFHPDNFALFILHISAAFQSGYVKMTNQELVTLLVGIYRAMIDPSCQTITADLQVLALSIFEALFEASDPAAIPRLVHDICEALWLQIPEAQKMDFHATYYRWAYLTPCSTKPMRRVRAAMALVFLKALANNPAVPLVAPPELTPNYRLGDPLITLANVIDFLNKTRVEKGSTGNWPRYANWVLLIDIATACFEASDILNIKRAISQWESGLTAFQAPARERAGNFDLQLARFKDLATHSLTKIRVINNSNVAKMPNAMESFTSRPKAKEEQ